MFNLISNAQLHGTANLIKSTLLIPSHLGFLCVSIFHLTTHPSFYLFILWYFINYRHFMCIHYLSICSLCKICIVCEKKKSTLELCHCFKLYNKQLTEYEIRKCYVLYNINKQVTKYGKCMCCIKITQQLTLKVVCG